MQVYYAIVDEEDHEKLLAYKWHLSNGYAIKSQNYTTISMHKFMLGEIPGKEIDHINGNKLDNRKSNLRFCTRRQNQYNAKPKNTNKSGFKGISWDSTHKKWRAALSVAGRCKFIGNFVDKMEAVKAYNKAVKIYHKEYAWLNEIPISEKAKDQKL